MITARIDAVVIGASAGGIEALAVLLPALPASFRPAVLIVLHLPRERPSLLVDIFQKRCARPVREAEDKEPVEPGTVYFAPPDYHLLVEKDRQLALSADEPVHYSRPSIDVLFESAAEVYGERLLGIILSGGNEDGAAGLQAVRQAGGVTVVQQPESAKVPLMVVSALQRGPADFVLPLEKIAELPGENCVKCLLVDDLEENLLALAALLQRQDVEILTARSGAEALELLLVHDVALAFLDVQMPEMDGFELAELMRGSERTRQVPIIFVTAGARDQHRLFKGYESGAVDFLFKPIEPHILQNKADVFFQLHRQKLQLARELSEKTADPAAERDAHRRVESRSAQSSECGPDLRGTDPAPLERTAGKRHRRTDTLERQANEPHDRGHAGHGACAPGRRNPAQAGTGRPRSA